MDWQQINRVLKQILKATIIDDALGEPHKVNDASTPFGCCFTKSISELLINNLYSAVTKIEI